MPFFEYDGLKVFYRIEGSGKPLLLLHGNTVSSEMFSQDITFFSKNRLVIAIDSPGFGKSDRLSSLRDDFWYYNSQVALFLCQALKLSQIDIIGTSGGSTVALNLTMQKPDLVDHIIADSSPGNHLTQKEVSAIKAGREHSKKTPMADYWKNIHGADWERVIDLDTAMLERVAENNLPLLNGDLSKISGPVLFTGSLRDEAISHIEEKVSKLALQIKKSLVLLFPNGYHPFLISRNKEFRQIAMKFLNDDLF